MSLELLGFGATLSAVAVYVGYRIVTGGDGGEEPVSVSATPNEDPRESNGDEDPAHRSVSPQNTGETELPPDRVLDVGSNLDDITGVGETRADDLRAAGFHDAEDIYFADDEELTDVYGVGEYTVEQVRGDIGSAE